MAGFPGPGDRIEARCTRCNDVTGHVVVALVGGEIVKVECRACGSVHKYYPPVEPKKVRTKASVCRVKAGEDRKDAVNAQKAVPASTVTRQAPPRGAAAKAQKAAMEMEQSWQHSMNDTLATARPYSMQEPYVIGDVVDHPKFGNGVVQEVFPPNKMQILFRDGVRMLRCSC